MLVHVLLYVSALAVKQDHTPLRAGCDAEDQAIATLAAGTPVEIRFRLADGSDCFKVAATVDGKTITGYLAGAALTGVDAFERDRASAASVDVAQALPPVESETRKLVARSGDPILTQASQLLESNQPSQALDLLEHAVPRYRKDPNVLLLAGLAAYRSDRLQPALDYWKQSLDLAPNEPLQRIYDKVRREAEADRGGDLLYGARVSLRFEGQRVPRDTARTVLAVLDEEFNRISGQLGCTTGERIAAIAQTREDYLRSTGAAEWSGGQYDGRIHIALAEGTQVGPGMRRALAHEMVHACLANLNGGRWPAWLQEGLAQKLSGDTLAPRMRDQLHEFAEFHVLPKLENLSQDWSRMNSDNARMAYNLALAAVDTLYENYSGRGIRNILNNPDSLRQITPDLDKKLGL